MKNTYITLLNEFGDLMKRHHFTPLQENFYYRILRLFNENFWKPITMSNVQMSAHLNITEKALTERKHALQREGLLVYRVGTTKVATTYYLPSVHFDEQGYLLPQFVETKKVIPVFTEDEIIDTPKIIPTYFFEPQQSNNTPTNTPQVGVNFGRPEPMKSPYFSTVSGSPNTNTKTNTYNEREREKCENFEKSENLGKKTHETVDRQAETQNNLRESCAGGVKNSQTETYINMDNAKIVEKVVNIPENKHKEPSFTNALTLFIVFLKDKNSSILKNTISLPENLKWLNHFDTPTATKILQRAVMNGWSDIQNINIDLIENKTNYATNKRNNTATAAAQQPKKSRYQVINDAVIEVKKRYGYIVDEPTEPTTFDTTAEVVN